jgi:dTDP-4-amino-4,6-dideoxygalactose transaminase
MTPDGFDFDLDALSSASDAETLCIIPTHLGGRVTPLAPVLDIAQKAGAYVIEDAAQAFGASWKGAPAGTLGDIGFYSLACGKGLTLYEGGVMVARDPEIRAALRRLSDETVPFRFGLEFKRCSELIGYRLGYNPVGLGLTYGFRLRYWLNRRNPVRAVGDDFGPDIPLHQVSGWRKRVGTAALRRLPAAIRENVARGRRRAQALALIPGLHLLDDSPDSCGTWPFLTAWFDSEEASRRALSSLWRSGLGVTRLFIHPLTGYSYLKGIVPALPMPKAEAFAARAFTLSNSPWLTDDAFESIRTVLAESA